MWLPNAVSAAGPPQQNGTCSAEGGPRALGGVISLWLHLHSQKACHMDQSGACSLASDAA